MSPPERGSSGRRRTSMVSWRSRCARPRGAGILLALLLVACGASATPGERAPERAAPAERTSPPSSAAAPAPASSAASPPPLLKARSAYTSINAVCAPWWMAQEAGYFREQGLDVELGHVDPGASLAAAMHN